jgi:hypothetical protein
MSGCRFIIVIILKEAIESWVGGFQLASGPLRTWDSEEARLCLPAGNLILRNLNGKRRL